MYLIIQQLVPVHEFDWQSEVPLCLQVPDRHWLFLHAGNINFDLSQVDICHIEFNVGENKAVRDRFTVFTMASTVQSSCNLQLLMLFYGVFVYWNLFNFFWKMFCQLSDQTAAQSIERTVILYLIASFSFMSKNFPLTKVDTSKF